MDFNLARFNMVEQQVRTWDVLDQEVLDLMSRLPREKFVPAGYERLAHADTEVPLAAGQLMLPPRVAGRLVQSLQLGDGDRVLEVGTGSGYVTAMLAALSRHVVSIERVRSLHEAATATLHAQGIENVSLHLGDGARGWPGDAPYDAIAVTGSTPILDDEFLEQLAIGGRLFVTVGLAPAMETRLITRTGEDQWHTESLFETVITPLHGVTYPDQFVL